MIRGTPDHTQPNVVVPEAAFSWWLSSCKKTWFTWFFPNILMIKDSNNLTGWEAQLATADLNWQSKMLSSLDDYILVKKRRTLTLSRHIDDHRILQSDWMKKTTDHTQPKVVALDATLPQWLSSGKKSKIDIDSFQIYWWSKNPAIWLVESILGCKAKAV